jgi:DNA polymerase III delta prime subunit
MDLSQFIGNEHVVEEVKRWLEQVIENPKHPRRICFLTGSVGTGKSTLVKLLLKEYNFTIREFLSSSLRIKQERNILYQTFIFRDVLALVHNKKKRKAIIVDDFENMALATQEVFRTLKSYLKKSVGIPVFFIGSKYFKSKKPLMGCSVYFRLKPRSLKDMKNILRQIAPRKISKEEEKMICKKAGGDPRNIINYFENNILEENKRRGPTYSLHRIMTEDLGIEDIKNEILMESEMLILGLHHSYLQVSKNNLKNIAELFSVYSYIKDYERHENTWDLSDLANSIPTFGYRIFREKSPKMKEGDKPVEAPLCNKTLRGALNKQIINNYCFKMDSTLWRPKNIRTIAQLVKIKDPDSHKILKYIKK